MGKATIIFHVCVVCLSTTMFFLKWTAANDFIEIPIKVLGKLVPLFCIAFSMLQIFKLLEII